MILTTFISSTNADMFSKFGGEEGMLDIGRIAVFTRNEGDTLDQLMLPYFYTSSIKNIEYKDVDIILTTKNSTYVFRFGLDA